MQTDDMSLTPCPCGSQKPFSFCCEPAINGTKPALTAEALMRSRYTAFSLGCIDYLIATAAPETKPEEDRALLEEQVQSTQWQSLTIVATKAGSASDTTGEVSFEATFSAEDETGTLIETSSFRKDDNRWYYVDGDVEVEMEGD